MTDTLRIARLADEYGRAIIPTMATVKGIEKNSRIAQRIFAENGERADGILFAAIKRQDRNDAKVSPFGAFDNHGTNVGKGQQLRIRHWTMGYELMCTINGVPVGEAIYLPCYVGIACNNGVFDAWSMDSEHIARDILGSQPGAIALSCRACNDMKGKSIPAPTVIERLMNVAAFWNVPRGGDKNAAAVRFFHLRERRTAKGSQNSWRYEF